MWEDAFVDVLGTRVHLLRAGSGRPVVLLHGLVGSALNWWRNIPVLARDASVYALDMVNMGRSARVAGLDVSLAATADRVAACMEALGLDSAEIGAHSHGGAVALMLAARHPERVRSLMLFAPANPYSDLGDRLVKLYSSALGRPLAQIATRLPRPAQLFALGRMYGDPGRIVAGSLEGYTEGLRVPGTARHILGIVRRWFADMAELEAVLPLVEQVPALLVWGDRDRAVSLESGMRLTRELAASELVVVPGGGHILFEEMPEAANRAMLEWLRRDERVELTKRYTPASLGLRPETAVLAAARSGMASGLRQLSPGV